LLSLFVFLPLFIIFYRAWEPGSAQIHGGV
jgi:hypothetical protein